MCVIGIHKEGNKFRPVILDNLENEENGNENIDKLEIEDSEEEKEEKEETEETEENEETEGKEEKEETEEKKLRFVRHGLGIGYYPNGTYKGNWVNDKKHGYGQYNFNNGDIYIGEFRNDKIDGKGVFYINHVPNNKRKFEGRLYLGIPENFDVYNSFLA